MHWHQMLCAALNNNLNTGGASNQFIDELIAANGSLNPWQSHRYLNLVVQFGGLAFQLKSKSINPTQKFITIDIREEKVHFQNFPGPNATAMWSPLLLKINAVKRIYNQKTLASIRRRFYWDNFDLLYFVGYACYNYFIFPYLLTKPYCHLKDVTDIIFNGSNVLRFHVKFDSTFPTHCSEQYFYIDSDGKLIRHDYDPVFFMPWAKACHLCLDHIDVFGIKMPSHRKALPRTSSNSYFHWPVMVWINVHSASFSHQPLSVSDSDLPGS